MTAMIVELYAALRAAGAREDKAQAAATALASTSSDLIVPMASYRLRKHGS